MNIKSYFAVLGNCIGDLLDRLLGLFRKAESDPPIRVTDLSTGKDIATTVTVQWGIIEDDESFTELGTEEFHTKGS